MAGPDGGLDRDQLRDQIRRNLADIRAAIGRAGGSEATQLVAVSKGQSVESICAAVDVGLELFGENYADELVQKATDPKLAGRPVRWTFQGRLQTNKINRLVPHVTLWQSIDTVERAEALAKRAPSAPVLVQLNLTGAAQRSGTSIESAGPLIERCRSLGLAVQGVMGIGPDPTASNAEESETAFRRAVAVADSYDLAIRSLGMSSDFEIAVRAGSNMVRVGSLLFGPREGSPTGP
jgi:PLP dependent protein